MASRFLTPFGGRGGLLGHPLSDLHREIDRLFDDAFRVGMPSVGYAPAGMAEQPRIDVHERDNELCVTADLPGVAPDELDLRIDGDLLVLSGERKREGEHGEEGYRVMERSVGRFERSLRLPFSPDPQQVRADFKDGVLTVHVPRQAQLERGRRIAIGGAAQPSSQQSSPTAKPTTPGSEGQPGMPH